MQVGINRGHEVLSRLRLDPLDLALNVAATIHDHFPIAVAPAQVLVVNFLQTFLTDDVARLESLLFVLRQLQLLRANLADIAEHVTERAVFRITTLRLLLFSQLRKFQLVSLHPDQVNRSRVLFDDEGFKSWL